MEAFAGLIEASYSYKSAGLTEASYSYKSAGLREASYRRAGFTRSG